MQLEFLEEVECTMQLQVQRQSSEVRQWDQMGFSLGLLSFQIEIWLQEGKMYVINFRNNISVRYFSCTNYIRERELLHVTLCTLIAILLTLCSFVHFVHS